MGKTIRITKEIEEFLKRKGKYGETASDVLKRLLKITNKRRKDEVKNKN